MIDILVIGGSAGALGALLAIVRDLPARFPIPIVIAMHLPPDQPNLLPAIIARATGHDAHEADDKEPLLPGSIAIAPPNYHLLVGRDRRLALSVDGAVHFSRPSIDVLFESAAAAFGAAAAGLILSGANEDGAAGLARIARAGGAALIQDPATAPHAAMPAAARDAAPTARVLSVLALGPALAQLGEESP